MSAVIGHERSNTHISYNIFHTINKASQGNGILGLVSQKVVNRTISNLPYDHLPTKFATVSQNLLECFYDLRFTTCG